MSDDQFTKLFKSVQAVSSRLDGIEEKLATMATKDEMYQRFDDIAARLDIDDTGILHTMQLGVVQAFDAKSLRGLIVSPGGERLELRFGSGQTLIFGGGLRTPQFSGRHAQRTGHALKKPRVGDPVVFAKGQKGTVEKWAYARHFVDALERQFGTEFASTSDTSPTRV